MVLWRAEPQAKLRAEAQLDLERGPGCLQGDVHRDSSALARVGEGGDWAGSLIFPPPEAYKESIL